LKKLKTESKVWNFRALYFSTQRYITYK